MHFSHILIKNFRAIEEVSFDLSPRANVIVGPNAVGKTTILQALRLTKSLLAPRVQSEGAQTLISLSAASPHFPNRIHARALARDPGHPVEIRASVVFSESEQSIIINSRAEIAQALAMAQFGLAFQSPATAIQFLASEAGRQVLASANDHLNAFFDQLSLRTPCTLGLEFDPLSGQLRPVDPVAGIVVAFLDGRLPPQTSVFSYFPADRALPVGEVPVQVGSADLAQQVEAHNSQPHLKYARLKNLLFNTIVLSEGERASFKCEFQRIFDGLMRGKRIDDFGVNEIGMLSVFITETETGRSTEIDSLSSGEKNLILTCLLIAKGVSQGGVVLFDEPELHLNSSVCKELLPYLIKEYADRLDLQFIVCTHSPDILSTAFEADDCKLFHLKSATNISPVGRFAQDEYAEALAKLGTSVGESMLFEGTILVEGDDDVDYLRVGFSELLRKFSIKDRGGRREVEKAARKIQELEARGEKVSPIYIIFDRDTEPTEIKPSRSLRVLQWSWRCIDNYLIDLDVIAELMRDGSIAREPITDSGEVVRLLKEIAFGQISRDSARQVFLGRGYKSPGPFSEDLAKSSLDEIAGSLFARMIES